MNQKAFIDEDYMANDYDMAISNLVDAGNEVAQSTRRPNKLLIELLNCVIGCAEAADLSDYVYEDITNYVAKWHQK